MIDGLDELTTDEKLQVAIRLACEDLPAMAQALGYESQGEWSPFHYDMMDEADRADGTHLLLVPRGHLKTSLVTVCYAAKRIRKDPNVRILLASSTATLAEGILSELKRHLEESPIFEDVRNVTPGHWSSEAITVKRTLISRSPTVRAVGVGGSVVGEHYDVILCDDVVDTKNTATKDLIDKTRDWYRMLLPLLEPDGIIIVIGTRYHFADLYGDLLGEHEETRAMAKGVTHFVRQVFVDGSDGQEPLWPQKFTVEVIDDLRKMGSYLFGCQYLNNPADPDSAIFKRGQIVWVSAKQVPPREECRRVTVSDWAMSEETSADYTVIATVDVDRQARKWVRKITRARWGLDRQDEAIDAACRHLEEWEPDRFGMQKVTLDRTIGRPLKIRAGELRLRLPLVELAISDTTKFSRIVGLQPDFEGSRIFFVEGCLEGEPDKPLTVEQLVDEITRFPKAPHDDILDALADVNDTADRVPARSNRDHRQRLATGTDYRVLS